MPSDGPAPREFDPFSPRLAFVDRLAAAGMRRRLARHRVTVIAPIDTRADQLVDFDALDRLTSWSGLFTPPREMHEDAYPTGMIEALARAEPQFFLRNIARSERFVDLEERLEFKRADVSHGLPSKEELTEVREARYQPPKLLGEMSLAYLFRLSGERRRLVCDTVWARHFCREIKANVVGPMWRYDPDAQPEGNRTHEPS